MCVTRSLCRNKRIFGFETNWLNCFSESKRFRRWLGHGYLRETAATDLDVRIAGLGALWQAVMLGFAGLDLGDGTLGIDPRLPPQWRSLSFRVFWRGRSVALCIAGRTVEATLVKGEPMEMRIATPRGN